MSDSLDTHQKALALNLDPSKYGVIAEIGAGQEVARWFFRVGAAAGTVAKTLSAYDMAVSDALYGQSSRYVARDRLSAMLNVEYERLVAQVSDERGSDCTFFAFADTLSARNFKGTNVCHGWMGLRFQPAPGSETSTVRLHVGMNDPTNLLQQQAVGSLGVNLIHAAFFRRENMKDFLESLREGTGLDRIEVDHIDFEGDAFDSYRSADAPLGLLRAGLSRAVVYAEGTGTSDPMTTLYKRPVVVERGSFSESNDDSDRIVEATLSTLSGEAPDARHEPIAVFEVSLENEANGDPLSDREIVECAGRLCTAGRPVLLTRFTETYHLTPYLKRYSDQPIRFAMSLLTLTQVFDETAYEHLDGGLVEAISRLLSSDVRLYVVSMDVDTLRPALSDTVDSVSRWKLPETGMASVDNVEPVGRVRHLYRYLHELGALMAIKGS